MLRAGCANDEEMLAAARAVCKGVEGSRLENMDLTATWARADSLLLLLQLLLNALRPDASSTACRLFW